MVRHLASIAVLMLAAVLPGPAFAHHALDGRAPTTLMEGLISGLAHPVLGLDHLVFLLAAGLAAGASRLPFPLPLAFVLASVAGIGMHVALFEIPASEPAVAVTILALGIAAGRRGEMRDWVWLALFAIAGVLHGYAYGASVVGAQTTPLFGYLVGIAGMQITLAGLTWIAGLKLADGVGHARAELRHLGALLAVIGVVFFVAALRTTA